jgi:hypothetical protein
VSRRSDLDAGRAEPDHRRGADGHLAAVDRRRGGDDERAGAADVRADGGRVLEADGQRPRAVGGAEDGQRCPPEAFPMTLLPADLDPAAADHAGDAAQGWGAVLGGVHGAAADGPGGAGDDRGDGDGGGHQRAQADRAGAARERDAVPAAGRGEQRVRDVPRPRRADHAGQRAGGEDDALAGGGDAREDDDGGDAIVGAGRGAPRPLHARDEHGAEHRHRGDDRVRGPDAVVGVDGDAAARPRGRGRRRADRGPRRDQQAAGGDRPARPGGALAPRVAARPPDAAAEPDAVPGSPRDGGDPRASVAAGVALRGAVPRPRPLQEHQRQPGALGGRPAADRLQPAAVGVHRRGGHAGAPGRRRVCDLAAAGARRERRDPGGGPGVESVEAAVLAARAGRVRADQRGHRVRDGGVRAAGGRAARRGHGDVPGQTAREGPLRAV